jgi:hypothetical protein
LRTQVYDTILSNVTNPNYDSFYIAVYTSASEAASPGHVHLRGQIHSIVPGVAGNLPPFHTGLCT